MRAKRILVLLFLLLVASLMPGCQGQTTETQTPGAEKPSAQSITLYMDAPVFPLVNMAKEITFYPDGSAELTDYMVYDEENGLARYPEGELPILNHYTFQVPPDAFADMEQALAKDNFYSLPEDFGVLATDTSYSYIIVERDGRTYTCGAAGWPDELADSVASINGAIGKAYFADQGQENSNRNLKKSEIEITRTLISYNLDEPETITVWETTLRGDGTETVREYGPYSQPLSKLGLDFKRDEHLLLHESEQTIDLHVFNALVDAVQKEGFFTFPAENPASDNGTSVDLSSANEKNYITVKMDGKEHTSLFTGYVMAYAPDGFRNIYSAFQSASASKPPEEPMDIKEIFEWAY